LLRLYGETDDATATDAASRGDTASESPLRKFAFRFTPVSVPADALPAVAAIPLARLDVSRYITSSFTPPVVPSTTIDAAATPFVPAVTPVVRQDNATPAPVRGYYRGADPLPSTSPAGVRFDLASAPSAANPQTFAPVAPLPDNTGVTDGIATINVPVRVGPVNFQGRVEGGESLASDTPLHSNTYGAGANFNVKAGRRALNVDVASRFEHLTRNDSLLSQSFDGASTWEFSSGNLPVLVPAFADVSKYTISAGVALPVTRRLTAGVQYGTQHLLGGYGAPGLNNLDARNDVYGAKLTYQLPHSTAITFSAKQYHYQDNLIPANTFLETREDVNLTVKF
jgi:hypothetical protein